MQDTCLIIGRGTVFMIASILHDYHNKVHTGSLDAEAASVHTRMV